MPFFKKNKSKAPPRRVLQQSPSKFPAKFSSNPMRGGACIDDTTTGIVADEVGVGRFQEQVAATADLLQNYRELDGKDDDAFIAEITEDAENLYGGGARGAWLNVALCHGGEATAGKLMTAMGDFSINSALFLSFLILNSVRLRVARRSE
jgi:hypothetical protein